MKITLLFFIIFIILSNASLGFDSPLEEHILDLTYGLYYDNSKSLNQFFENNNIPLIEKNYTKTVGLNYHTNICPFLFDEPSHFFYSVSLVLPVTHSIRGDNFDNELQTYSLFLETFVFESYLKKITIRPILGIGLSQTELIIRKSDDGFVEFKELNIKTNSAIRFTKFSALLNIGGGGAFRYKLIDDAFKTKNLILGFDIRYSIPLDILNIYNDKWKVYKSNISIGDYHAPGLSLDFYLGIEVQKKKYWK